MQEVLKNNDIEIYGVCEFSAFSEHLIPCRAINRLPKNAKSIIMFAFPYNVKHEKPKNISRYSAVDDYHKIVGDILNRICEQLKDKYSNYTFCSFVDSSPIPEVKAGQKAGIGVIGKNGLLITKKYGSYVFLGEIVTDMKLKYSNENGVCLNCGICEKFCPSNCIGKKKDNCLSEITQKKGELTEKEQQMLIENYTAWGCDICQEVCPMNSKVNLSKIPDFLKSYKSEVEFFEDIKNRAFNWRGKKVIERNLKVLEKNEYKK